MSSPRATKAELLAENAELRKSVARERAGRQRSESRIGELESTVETRTRELSEALEQQTATREILRVISSSPTDLAPVFSTILANATRLCEAQLGNLFVYDGDAFRAVAHHNASQPFIDILSGPLRPGPESGVDRFLADPRPFQVADVRATPGYVDSEPYAVVAADLEGIRTLVCVRG